MARAASDRLRRVVVLGRLSKTTSALSVQKIQPLTSSGSPSLTQRRIISSTHSKLLLNGKRKMMAGIAAPLRAAARCSVGRWVLCSFFFGCLFTRSRSPRFLPFIATQLFTIRARSCSSGRLSIPICPALIRDRRRAFCCYFAQLGSRTAPACLGLGRCCTRW